MRQDQDQKLPLGKFQEIVECQKALALLDLVGVAAALAPGEKPAEPAIGGTVARIDEDIRRAVHEDDARADQKLRLVQHFRIFKLAMGAHDSGERVVIGNADRGQTEPACLMHIILRMRTAAQEGEIRCDADLGIGDGHRDISKSSVVIASEAKQSTSPLAVPWIASSLSLLAMTNLKSASLIATRTARARTSWRGRTFPPRPAARFHKGRRGKSRNAGPRHPRFGNN